MPTIRSLSQSMINKIAAGEVIERPASVVKELVENSIDAGATRIDVALENGGSDLIHIVDNGCGIEPDQLELALSPHATSKLTDADDLFHILSFGFRGEALASVAEISQLTLKSRTADNNEGATIQSNGGERSVLASCGMPAGTQMEVRNLFFNTPVRRRYLKSVPTEFGHVSETFTRLVLPQPHIHFTLKHNGKIIHELPPTEEPLTRIRQLFGEDMTREMIAVESPASAVVRVSGYVSHPNQHRPNNRMQYFFLNRRSIRDRALQHALNEAYRGLLVSGRFPLAFLQIELPPDTFDVNVHPTKMEVRFLDSNRVYTGFLGAIREKFLRSDLRSKVHTSPDVRPQTADGWERRQTADSRQQQRGSGDAAEYPPAYPHEEPQHALDPAAAEKKRRTVQDWIVQIQTTETDGKLEGDGRRQTADGSRESAAGVPPRVDYSQRTVYHSSDKGGDGRQQRADSRWQQKETGCGAADSAAVCRLPSAVCRLPSAVCRLPSAVCSQPSAVSSLVYSRTPEGHLVVQMLDRYLVMETPDSIVFIDQHALHERILYEQLREQMLPESGGGQLESQRLLVPIPVDLSPNEFSCVQENTEFFKTLGLHVEPFGGNTILISAFPAVLSKTLPEEVLSSLVEPFLELGKKLGRVELLDELLHSMACKAAVKAGERLSSGAIEHLIQRAEAEIHSHHCPHGRPSTLVFTREEIDKMFDRT